MNLDPRQRAMLQEMGITIWWPQPAATPAPAQPAQEAGTAVAVALAETIPAVVPRVAPAAAGPEVPVLPTAPSTAAQPAAARPPLNTTLPAPHAPSAEPAVAWRMAAPVQAFPNAHGGTADDAWLILWECPQPATPLEGDSGKLLNNMLRALRLHHSPHVWIAGVQRPGHEALPTLALPAQAVSWQDLPQGLPAAIQQIHPARIVVLGLHAARAVLGRDDALGLLRAQVHELHHTPAIVSYDPAYLLRAPHAKPAAWADLCRAHALRPPPAR